MGLKESALEAYQEEEAERKALQEKENAEKRKWIIEELHRLFRDAMNGSEIIHLNHGMVDVDGILFKAYEDHVTYRLQMEHNGNWVFVMGLSDIGKHLSERGSP